MHDALFHELIAQAGFRRIGELSFRLIVSAWWHPSHHVELLLVRIGSRALLKGHKSYYLRSVAEEGITFVRDLSALHDYLEAHFPELRLSFSHFRDVTSTLAAAHLRRMRGAQRTSVRAPTVVEISLLQQQLESHQHSIATSKTLLRESFDDSSLLRSHLKEEITHSRQRARDAETELSRARDRGRLYDHLQREYEEKGSAACMTFSIGSNLHVVDAPASLSDALAAVVKELLDAHRYQVSQKLGGRLSVHVAEATEPLLAWIEEWFGGALSPRDLERLGPEFELLTNPATEQLMVTADEEICVDDATKELPRHVGARVLSDLVERLDRSEARERPLDHVSVELFPARIGSIVSNGKVTSEPAVLPLGSLQHAYASGTTGAGKSFLVRALIEEAATHEGLGVLVLDPRNQGVGLLVPEDRPEILSRYEEFGLSTTAARGFSFEYFTASARSRFPLPQDLRVLGTGRSVVSFKGLSDQERCAAFAQILSAVFDGWTAKESSSLRLLIVVEEAHLFVKRRVDAEARSAGAQAEIALDRIVREGRKYGICVIVVSQTIRDYGYEAATIRQNTNTKIFLHNSDREVEYASDFLGDGHQLLRLPPGVAIVHNASWGAITVKVRPPYSKVWEFSDEETARLLQPGSHSVRQLSERARRLLALVRDHAAQHGVCINLTKAADQLGITSKRALLQAVDELEAARLVTSRRLIERGQPRILEPLPSSLADETLDATRTNRDRSATASDEPDATRGAFGGDEPNPSADGTGRHLERARIRPSAVRPPHNGA